ncbi:MAG: hypothetical protein I3273_07070, partial [Candidatus Moeniiplasma glomeromycotorum]|nr:hypothetical protein [Candidatus Moeniiplasma glomeromycotorum]
MTSPFADTSNIELKILLDSRYKAEELIRKFVNKHLEKPENIPNKCKLRMNNPNIRTQYFGLIMFYQQILIPHFRTQMETEAEEKIAKEWRERGEEPYFKSAKTGATATKPGFKPEVDKLIEKLEKSHKFYGRARIEETRLSSADNIIKGGPVESDVPSGLDLDDDGQSENPKTPPPKTPPKPKKNNGEKTPSPDGKSCPGEYCGGVKKATGWRQGGGKNKWYCQFCWGAVFGADEDKYITKIKGLDKLTEEEKQFYINRIYDSSVSKFESIWLEAKNKNDSQKDRDEDDNEEPLNFSTKIAQAIQEIEAELNKEPKILLEKDEDWRDYIEASLTLPQLQERKNKILAEIRLLRQKQQGGDHNLTELRTHYTNLIKSSLNKNPPISPS